MPKAAARHPRTTSVVQIEIPEGPTPQGSSSIAPEVGRSPIADRLEGILAAKGMNPRQLEKASGISGDGIRNIIRGKSRSPKAATLEVIAKGLGVSLAYLMGLPGAKASDPPDSPIPLEAFPPEIPARPARHSAPPAAPEPAAPPAPAAEASATIRIERILHRMLRSAVTTALAATDAGSKDPATKIAEARGALQMAKEALQEIRALRPELDQPSV